MFPTVFHQPNSLAEASALFAKASEARYLSGGQTLIPTMKQRLVGPSDVISLTGIAELKGITVGRDAVTIGGGMTHFEVAHSKEIASAIPTLSELVGSIGDPAVRHRGTIGGSLANNDPSADYPAAALALGATITTDRRDISADDYFRGLFVTALDDGEIVCRVSFPIPAKSAYRKFRNPASHYAMAAVFVAVLRDGQVRVAVTGASGDGVYRATDLEQALTARFSTDSLAGIEPDPDIMMSDIHGTAEYRANLVKVLASRAVAAIA